MNFSLISEDNKVNDAIQKRVATIPTFNKL